MNMKLNKIYIEKSDLKKMKDEVSGVFNIDKITHYYGKEIEEMEVYNGADVSKNR